MNFSISEIIVILLIALLVIKPEQLPDVTFTLGKYVKMIKQLMQGVKKEMNQLIDSVDKPDERKREQS